MKYCNIYGGEIVMLYKMLLSYSLTNGGDLLGPGVADMSLS